MYIILYIIYILSTPRLSRMHNANKHVHVT